MARPNWGRGLAAFGGAMQNLYGMRMQQQMEEQQLAEQRAYEQQVYGQRVADQGDLLQRRHELGVERDTLRRLYEEPDPVDPMSQMWQSPEMQQPLGPAIDGGGLPMTTGDPNMDYLASIRQSGIPLTNEDAAGFLMKAALKNAGGSGNITPAEEMVPFTIPFGPDKGQVHMIPKSEYVMRYNQMHSPEPEAPEPKMMTDANRRGLVDSYFPTERQKIGYNEYKTLAVPGLSGISQAEIDNLGLEGYNAIAGNFDNLTAGIPQGTPPGPYVEQAIMQTDLPNEWDYMSEDAFSVLEPLREAQKEGKKIKVDDKGTPDKSDDVLSWSGSELSANPLTGFRREVQKTMAVSEAIDALKGKSKEGTVSYKAALEVLESLGIDPQEYNMYVPKVAGMRPQGAPQVEGDAPVVDFTKYKR